MAYVAVIVSVAPIRAEASHRSEMVSQLLFGEVAAIEDNMLKGAGSFTKIKCLYDGYEGWCQTAQLVLIDEAAVSLLQQDVAADFTNTVVLNGIEMQVPFGASIGLFSRQQWAINKYFFEYKGVVAKPNAALFTPDYIRHIATTYLNVPYLWGGRSVYGIDCSGFTQQVYRFFNKPLARDAYMQAIEGEVVGFLQEAVCGDLAFFDNEEGKITHVGIMLTTESIIHSSGKVRIDKIDNMGIVNSDTGERTHQLRIIKRYA